MNKIKECFDARFGDFGIFLSEDDYINKKSGMIRKNGWAIHYLFRNDGSRDYIEYYSSHRMTDDNHVRIYDDGTREYLEAIRSWCPYSQNAEKNKKLENEYFENNRRIYNDLKKIGLING
jgi:hypothetical protein